MKKYKIILDSLSSMPIELAQKYDIEKLQYSVSNSNGDVIVDDFSEALIDQVSADILNKIKYQTGMYTPNLIEEKINEFLKEYNQVIYICSSPQFTGQYEATKYLQEKHPGRVLIVNSGSICTINEELANSVMEYFKDHETIDIETINEMAKTMNATACTLFVPKYIDGLIHSGRIPSSVAKLLKLAKVTPIIKTEEKNKPCKIIKNTNIDITKLLDALDSIFNKKIKPELIKKVYIIQTLVNKEKIKEIINIITNYYKIAKEKILIRLTPLPVAVYTLKESIGIGLYTSIVKDE